MIIRTNRILVQKNSKGTFKMQKVRKKENCALIKKEVGIVPPPEGGFPPEGWKNGVGGGKNKIVKKWLIFKTILRIQTILLGIWNYTPSFVKNRLLFLTTLSQKAIYTHCHNVAFTLFINFLLFKGF
jgi:hypothetical protein